MATKKTKKSDEPVDQPATAPDLPDELANTIKTDKPAKSPKKTSKKPKPASPEPAAEPTPAEEPEPSDTPDESLAEPAEPADESPAIDLEDQATDQAVDEIIAHEADTQLAVDDAIAARQRAAQSAQPSAFAEVFFNKWTWITVVAVVALSLGFALLLTGF